MVNGGVLPYEQTLLPNSHLLCDKVWPLITATQHNNREMNIKNHLSFITMFIGVQLLLNCHFFIVGKISEIR